MIVRASFGRRVTKPRRSLRWLEYLFLFAGLIAVDYVIWVNVDTMVGQAYDSWSLDKQIAGQQPSFGDFLAEKFGRAPTPRTAAETAAAENAKRSQSSTNSKAHHKRLPTFALIGRIEIPRLGLKAIVREGVDTDTLQKAVGHMPSTALPGENGNVAFAAHRDTLFRKIRDIRKNDTISVETVGGTYDYVVESLKIVKPTDVSVLHATNRDQLLTLITCYPFNYIGSAPNRFIVRAHQVNVTAQSRQVRTGQQSQTNF